MRIGIIALAAATVVACDRGATPSSAGTPIAVTSATVPLPAPVASPAAATAGAGSNPDALACVASLTTTGGVVAKFDFRTMTGRVSIDGMGSGRRMRVKAVPYAATYALVFQSYDSGDQKPATESLTADKSVVARIVADGDKNRLYFDSDFTPPTPIPPVGYFRCR